MNKESLTNYLGQMDECPHCGQNATKGSIPCNLCGRRYHMNGCGSKILPFMVNNLDPWLQSFQNSYVCYSCMPDALKPENIRTATTYYNIIFAEIFKDDEK